MFFCWNDIFPVANVQRRIRNGKGADLRAINLPLGYSWKPPAIQRTKRPVQGHDGYQLESLVQVMRKGQEQGR